MNEIHPPLDKRCQIYQSDAFGVVRCANTGTHWQKWPGNVDQGEGDFFSWECDGPCLVEVAT